jgi:hypothetical protein
MLYDVSRIVRLTHDLHVRVSHCNVLQGIYGGRVLDLAGAVKSGDFAAVAVSAQLLTSLTYQPCLGKHCSEMRADTCVAAACINRNFTHH